MNQKSIFNSITQFAIPILTISGQIVLSLKFPQWALLINLSAQPFWLYSSWKAYKNSGQIGMFINTILMAIIISLGLINYWIL